MDTDQILVLSGVIFNFFVALGTISLALVTWFTLRQAMKLNRNRQADEIIGWAEDIIECGSTKYDDSEYPVVEGFPFSGLVMAYIKLVSNFELLKKRGQRLKPIVLSFRKKELDIEFENLMGNLGEHIEIRNKQMLIIIANPRATTLPKKFVSSVTEVATHAASLDSSVDAFLTEATKLKVNS